MQDRGGVTGTSGVLCPAPRVIGLRETAGVPYEVSGHCRYRLRTVCLPRVDPTVIEENPMDVYELPIVIASFESDALLGQALAIQGGSDHQDQQQ
jgi:hypothetical protein